MAKRTHKPPLCEVYWWDAVDRWEQFSLEEARKQDLTYRCSSGYLVLQDERRVIIAHDWDDPDEVCNVTVIPATWVERIKYAKRPKAAKPAAVPQTSQAANEPT